MRLLSTLVALAALAACATPAPPMATPTASKAAVVAASTTPAKPKLTREEQLKAFWAERRAEALAESGSSSSLSESDNDRHCAASPGSAGCFNSDSGQSDETRRQMAQERDQALTSQRLLGGAPR